MNKLPSIINTYQNTLKLYAKNFIPLLPITLLATLAIHFFHDSVSGFKVGERIQTLTGHDHLIIIGSFITYTLIHTLLFSIALYGMNQNKLPKKSFHYMQALEKGAQKTPVVLLAMIILITPFILATVGIFFATTTIGALIGLLNLPLLILLLVVFVYVYVSTALIVTREQSAINGLKRSWNLTKGHWWKTFVLVLILVLITMALSLLLKKAVGNYSNEISTFIVFSLGVALMLTHLENLEKVND
jgi:hypothetical protein